MRQIKVIFIIGKGRSGSTLIDNALGQVPGVFSAGEIWRRWKWQSLDTYPCGCGENLSDCPVWSKAIDACRNELRAEFGSGTTLTDMTRWEKEVLRWRGTPRLLAYRLRFSRRWPAIEALAHLAAVLYGAIADAARARVIVDSTKWPLHPALLGLVTGVTGYAVHLVRDPRAVAYSWRRTKYYPAFGEPMQRFGPVHTAISWNVRNLTSEMIIRRLGKRGLRMRYEDFVARPRTALQDILAMVGEGSAPLPFSSERILTLEPTHTVMGNPSRFATGPVEVRPDDEWRSRLTRRERAMVTVLTLPLLRRYGYPIRVATQSPGDVLA